MSFSYCVSAGLFSAIVSERLDDPIGVAPERLVHSPSDVAIQRDLDVRVAWRTASTKLTASWSACVTTMPSVPPFSAAAAYGDMSGAPNGTGHVPHRQMKALQASVRERRHGSRRRNVEPGQDDLSGAGLGERGTKPGDTAPALRRRSGTTRAT